MLAHLDSDEVYNEACLDNTLDALAAGFTSVEEFNQRQIEDRAHLSNEEALTQWRTRQARVRSRWAALGPDTEIATLLGPCPLRAHIWHIASEYATHADDMGVNVPPEAQQPRLMWRFQLSACVVQAKDNPPGLERRGDQMIVAMNARNLSLSAADFVAAVCARLDLPQNKAERQIVKALRALA